MRGHHRIVVISANEVPVPEYGDRDVALAIFLSAQRDLPERAVGCAMLVHAVVAMPPSTGMMAPVT